MRRLLASAIVSLDAVMQAPDVANEDPTGGFKFGGWTVPDWEGDDAPGETMGQLFEPDFARLRGRRPCGLFAACRPHHKDDGGMAFDAASRHVVTSSGAPLAWKGRVAVNGDTPAEIRRLKQEQVAWPASR